MQITLVDTLRDLTARFASRRLRMPRRLGVSLCESNDLHGDSHHAQAGVDGLLRGGDGACQTLRDAHLCSLHALAWRYCGHC